MLKIVEKILFHSVILVILFHAIIPHPHSNEMTEIQHMALHQNASTLLDDIRIAFHESNDENLDRLVVDQPEIIKISKSQTLSAVLYHSVFLFLKKSQVTEIEFQQADKYHKIFIVKLNGMRGPPLMA